MGRVYVAWVHMLPKTIHVYNKYQLLYRGNLCTFHCKRGLYNGTHILFSDDLYNGRMKLSIVFSARTT